MAAQWTRASERAILGPLRLTISLAVAMALLAPASGHAAARADLTVGKLPDPPATLAAGSSLSVKVTLSNKGGGKAKASKLAVVLSRDKTFDKKDVTLGLVAANAVKAKKKLTLTASVKTQATLAPGAWWLIVCADSAAKIKEASEKNNCATGGKPITVTLPTFSGETGPITGGTTNPGPNPGPGPGGNPTPGPGGNPDPTPGPGATPTPTPTPTPPPLDPHEVRALGTPTALPKGAVARLKDSSAFIYTGSGASQRGMQPSTISNQRVAVLRGRALDEVGAPLEGVHVEVLDHPEYGFTVSRADGHYDLVINGGSVTLVLDKPGLLGVQVAVDASWRDYAVVPDAILTKLSPKVTTIDPASATPLQVVTGATPAAGNPPSTLLVPQGTAPTMKLPDGSTQPLSSLNVRITEFSADPRALPGPMPGTAAPTYAAEFSVDQAIAAGATRVDFAKPLVDYTPNYIGAAVGSHVPTAWYDKEKAEWVPSKDGRVIKITGEVGGKAQLDTGGESLASLGIDDAELTRLAQLYDTGQELWRVLIDHFTPWDHNFPFGPPPGAKAPPLKEFVWKDPNDPCQRKGSTIACESQTLGEEIPVTGSPITLHYGSNRVPGYTANSKLEVPVTTGAVPDKLHGISLTLDVAGRHLEKRWCDPTSGYTGASTCQGYDLIAPNLTYEFDWDGKDAYGRQVQGRPIATVTVTYVYEFFYYEPDGGKFEESFGQLPSTAVASNGAPYCGNQQPFPFGGGAPVNPQALQEWAENVRQQHFFCGILIRESTQRGLGSWDSSAVDGLGGLTLSEHHGYDPVEHVVHKGDGTTVRSEPLGSVLRDFAGTNRISRPTAAPIDADNADLDGVADIAIGPNGEVFGASTGNQNIIWKATQDGKLRRIGGRDCDPFTPVPGPECPEEGAPGGDGGQADGALLGNDIRSLAAAPDGSVYFVVTGANTATNSYGSQNGFIRRIAPDGKLSTIAGREWKGGSGVTVDIGDGGPALGAAFDDPKDLALGPDGSLYLSERGTYTGGKPRVRKISPKGTVSTIAGGGTDNAADDQDLGAGEPATDQNLSIIYGIAVAPDGTVYLADPSGHKVQKIAVNGILTRVAGEGAGPIEYGEAGVNAKIGDPVRIALGPAGEMYIRVNTSGGGSDVRILRIAADGTVLPVAGLQSGSGSNSLNDDGEPANAAILYAGGNALEVQPDGELLLNDGREEVRRIVSPLPNAGPDSSIIPSPDGREAWAFDGTGRHLKTVDALTGQTIWSFDYSGALLTGIRDADNNLLKVERNGSGVATALVAPGGQRTTLTMDAGGRTSAVANPLGQTTALEYGPTGLLSKFTQPGARVSTYTYDGDGRLKTATNPSGAQQTFTRTETPSRTEVVAKSGEGRETHYVAEALPDGTRRRTVTKPSGAETILSVLPGGEQELTEADGTKTLLQMGRDPRWGASVPFVKDQTVTSPAGKSIHAQQSKSVTLSDQADPFSVTTQFTTLERTEGSSPSERTTSEYNADQKTLTTRSEENRSSETKLDDRGRVISVDPDGFGDRDPVTIEYNPRGLVSKVGQGTQFQTYTYDAAGRLVSRTDAAGQAITYEYDAADRMTARHLPGGHIYHYGYAADGTLATMTMPGGQVYGITVDGELRPTAIQPPTPAGAPYLRSYDLDGALKKLTLPSGAKHESSYSPGGLELGTEFGAERDAYTYPLSDVRPSSAARTRDADGGSTQTLGFTYDGFLPKTASQSGTAVGTFTYTPGPQLRLGQSELVSGADTVTTALTFDGDGLVTKFGTLTYGRDFSSGAVTDVTDGTLTGDYAYDSVGRLAERKLTIGGSVRYRLQVQRDPLTGFVKQRTETVNGAANTRDFAYDSRGQLATVKEGATTTEAYAYDGNGNRSSATRGASPAEAASYDASDRLTSRAGTSYTFNADGFLTARGADTFTYGASGDLLSATVGGATVTYGYDAVGRRAWRKQGSAVTTYLYGDPANVLRLSASRGPDGVLSTYAYDDEGALLTITRGATTYYVGTDQVGSPAVVLSAAGAVVARFPRDTYGRALPGGTTGPFDVPIGFAGGLEDPVTGLVRFGFRDYEPLSGRFTARDPTLFSGSPANLYAYAGSSPAGNVDPSGLFCLSASLYASVGGGASWCRKDGKTSGCIEGGVGVGGGVEVDPFGDTAKDGTWAQAELTGKYGPANATIGGELDLDCFNSRGYLKGGIALTGISAGVDTNGDISLPTFGGSEAGDFNGQGVRGKGGGLGAKAEGKIGIKKCWEY